MPKVNKHRVRRGNAQGPLPTGAKGGRGQHFLKNMAVVKAIVAKARIKSTDTVLEVGPGGGAMTVPMLEKVRSACTCAPCPPPSAFPSQRVHLS